MLPSFLATTLAIGLGLGSDDAKTNSPYDGGDEKYSVGRAEAFYRSKPLFVFRRLLKLFLLANAFVFKLLIDWRTDSLEENQVRSHSSRSRGETKPHSSRSREETKPFFKG